MGVGYSPLSALLAHPARKPVGDRGPRLRPVLFHELQQGPVLRRGPRPLQASSCRPLLLLHGVWTLIPCIGVADARRVVAVVVGKRQAVGSGPCSRWGSGKRDRVVVRAWANEARLGLEHAECTTRVLAGPSVGALVPITHSETRRRSTLIAPFI